MKGCARYVKDYMTMMMKISKLAGLVATKNVGGGSTTNVLASHECQREVPNFFVINASDPHWAFSHPHLCT